MHVTVEGIVCCSVLQFVCSLLRFVAVSDDMHVENVELKPLNVREQKKQITDLNGIIRDLKIETKTNEDKLQTFVFVLHVCVPCLSSISVCVRT